MPIAFIPSTGTGPSPGDASDVLLIKPLNAVIDPAPPTPLLNGHAVYIGDDAGTPTIYLCGASAADQPGLFIGFLHTPGILPGASLIASGRGSRVVPHVEGGGTLVVDQDVWLAVTPGEVVQTPPYGSGNTILKVGVAISTTELLLTTDFRQAIP